MFKWGGGGLFCRFGVFYTSTYRILFESSCVSCLSCFLFFFASGFFFFFTDFLKSMAASSSTFLMALILLPSCFCLFSLVGVEAGISPAALFSC